MTTRQILSICTRPSTIVNWQRVARRICRISAFVPGWSITIDWARSRQLAIEAGSESELSQVMVEVQVGPARPFAFIQLAEHEMRTHGDSGDIPRESF